MKQHFVILFSLCCLLLAGSGLRAEGTALERTHSLVWQGFVQDSLLPEGKTLAFDDAVWGDDFLPRFQCKYDSEIGQLEIKNIVTADFTAEEIAFLQKYSFPEVPEPDLIRATEKKQSKSLVSFLPIVARGAVPRKVISFTLVAQPKASALRAAKPSAHSYAGNSVLSTGKWVKISVGSSGIYKITYEDLVKWGIPKPVNARVFGYGGARLPEDFSQAKIDDLPQLSVWKSSTGSFGAGDYLLFYAQGVVSWQYDAAAKEFVNTVNPYSSAGYYFVSSDCGEEKIIAGVPPLDMPADTVVAYFRDYRLHEKEEVNLMSSGSVWYGERFDNAKSSYSFSFSFPDVELSKPALVYVDAVAKAQSSTSMQVSADGVSLGTLNYPATVDPYYARETSNRRTFSATPRNTVNITLKYNQAAIGSAWLNFVRVNAARRLNVSGNAMFFRNPDIRNRVAEYQIGGSAGYQVWDLTDAANIRQMPIVFDNNQYRMTDNTDVLKEYVILRPSADFPSPRLVGAVANQNLHSVPQVDYVIIAHPDYLKQAETLARKHEEKEGISTLVVTPEEVYNEFSSGTPDATAFRWLMKMFYDRNDAENAPKSLLLLGDGTYDNRGIRGSLTVPYNKLLTYQSANSLHETNSYVTDDYFGLLDDSEGKNISSDLLDIGVGRLPASTVAQAQDMVDKICKYIDNADKGYWKNMLCYVADDRDIDSDGVHVEQSDLLARFMETNYPMFQTSRIFLDAFSQQVTTSGQSYPLAKEKLKNALNSGCFIVNYTGHGSPESLATEGIVTRDDIKNMHNKRLPLFVTATCSFSRFDASNSSSGEDLLLKPDAGAIGLFSTTRTVYASPNYELNKKFNNHVFERDQNGKPLTLGEIMRRTKNDRTNEVNKLNFTLLADPALVLPMPDNRVELTEISSMPGVGDTIQALGKVTIKGIVVSPEGVQLSQFNGKLDMVLYDKQKQMTTLGNDGHGTYTYTERPDILLKGSTTVSNGEFSITILIPKDITYNYGKGRLNFYACDETNDMEANGYDESFMIGGANPDFEFEDEGPDIKMYINSPHFRSGDRVSAELLFVAQLHDVNGINTSGIGIGHDLQLTLNDNPNLSYTLNEYYTAAEGDFRSGTLAYKLPALPDGEYSLTFRAWDLLNNSSTQHFTFRVDADAKPLLYDVYPYPNPVSAATDNQVNFLIKHNQPQTMLKIKIDVYNASGSLAWTHETNEFADGNQSIAVWNMADCRVLPGVYACRISVANEQSGIYNVRTSKLIVK